MLTVTCNGRAGSATVIEELAKSLNKLKSQVDKKLNKIMRNVVEEIFTDIVKNTPQFTGQLASNWYIEFEGSRKGQFNRTPKWVKPPRNNFSAWWAYHKMDYKPFIKGADPAVSGSLHSRLENLKSLKGQFISGGWQSRATIINYAPYAKSVDKNLGPMNDKTQVRWAIREENLHYGEVFMVTYAQIKYSKLGNLKQAAGI